MAWSFLLRRDHNSVLSFSAFSKLCSKLAGAGKTSRIRNKDVARNRSAASPVLHSIA